MIEETALLGIIGGLALLLLALVFAGPADREQW